ncbi:hypothetical protein GCM10027299_28900 [Larkinella ripae]
MAAPKSFRLTDETIDQIKVLAELLKETELQILQRAVQALYDNRVSIVEEDAKSRISKAKESTEGSRNK